MIRDCSFSSLLVISSTSTSFDLSTSARIWRKPTYFPAVNRWGGVFLIVSRNIQTVNSASENK